MIAWPVIVFVFVASRIWLHEIVTPALDQDSYKYLGGADALLNGGPLPPLFNDLAVTGGGLHAVPGYAWFIEAVWRLVGRVAMSPILLSQSLVALVGSLAACNLVHRAVGPWTAIVLFSALTISPPIAWLEHMLMPDVFAPYLLFICVWLAVTGARGGKSGLVASSFMGGTIAGAQILLRTASQVYLPIPLIVAALSWKRAPASIAWMIFYFSGIMLVVTPWILDNHRRHGVYKVSHSMGRNLYFSALWTNTLDRREEAKRLGLSGPPTVTRSVLIADLEFRAELASGKTIAQADDAMRDRAIEAYRRSPLTTLVVQRFKVVAALFRPDPNMGNNLKPMRGNSAHHLNEYKWGIWLREWAEGRFGYRFSAALDEALENDVRHDPRALVFVRTWMDEFTLEGLPLLCTFLVATLVLMVLRSWLILFAFAAPVAAFLSVFLIVGAPLWRYQAALHPFMLVVIVTAISISLQTERNQIRLRRKLADMSTR